MPLLKQRFTFKYEIYDSKSEDFPNQTVTREMEGDITLNGLLEAFQSYLEGAGYVVDGDIGVIPDDVDISEVYPEPSITPNNRSLYSMRIFKS